MDTGNVKDNGAMRICIPYELEHRCAMCGCSCMAQLVGPLDEAELRAVESAREGLGASMPAGVNPIMKGVKPDGTCLHFLNFPQKRCVFLDGEHLCRIHGRYGAGQKPAACRRFPRIAIRTENEVRVGIKPTIRDYGVDEKVFLDQLDEMTEQAFDDQCTGANPRYPLMREIKQMYLNAYYGDKVFTEAEMPSAE